MSREDFAVPPGGQFDPDRGRDEPSESAPMLPETRAVPRPTSSTTEEENASSTGRETSHNDTSAAAAPLPEPIATRFLAPTPVPVALKASLPPQPRSLTVSESTTDNASSSAGPRDWGAADHRLSTLSREMSWLARPRAAEPTPSGRDWLLRDERQSLFRALSGAAKRSPPFAPAPATAPIVRPLATVEAEAALSAAQLIHTELQAELAQVERAVQAVDALCVTIKRSQAVSAVGGSQRSLSPPLQAGLAPASPPARFKSERVTNRVSTAYERWSAKPQSCRSPAVSLGSPKQMRREPRDHRDLKPLSSSRSNSECLNQMFPVVDPMFLQANSSGKQHVKSGPLSLLSFRSTSSRSWIAGVSKGSSNQRTSVGETRLSGKSVGNVEYKESPKQRLGSSISLVQAAETKSLNNSNLFTTRIGEVSRETTVTDDLRSVPFARNSTADHKKMDKPEKRALQWDALAFVIQSSMLFVIPGVVAFPTSLWTQNAVSLSYSFYFALDALSRVWTAGVRRTSALPVPSQRIRWTSKALQTRDRLWLCVDLVSSIPFAPIASALNVSPRLSSVLNCTYFAHFRRFASVKRFATRLIVFNHLSTSARAMAKMFATIFVYLHLSACYMVWTERMRGEAAGESVVGPKIGISGANWRDGYTLGIWGAVANCFAATIELPVLKVFFPWWPSTLQSYWLTIILVCLGACLSATFHGTVAAYSSGEGGDLAAAYGRKLDEIEEYMRHHSVPEMLRTLIGQSIGARYQGRAFNEEKILAGLNPSLRQEVLLSNCRTLLESIYFFRLPAGDERQSWVLRQLSLGLRCAVFSEGETVYLEGMPGSEMFLVVEGVASMWLGSRRLGFVDAGSWFGEFNLLTPGPRIDTVRAATKLSCLVLDRVTVQKIVDDVPEIAAKLTDLKQKCIETLHEICA